MEEFIPEKYKNNELILRKLKEQLAKDVNMVQINSSAWEGSDTATELIERFDNQLAKLIEVDIEKLTQLLYRVDVDEKRIKMGLSLARKQSASRFLAVEILKRELQKVIFKLQYAGQLPKEF